MMQHNMHAGHNFQNHIFGMILTQSLFVHPELSTRAQFVTYRPSNFCDLMFRHQTCPTWLKRWERIYILLLTVELRTYHMMATLVRMGLATRQWLSLPEHVEEMERQKKQLVPVSSMCNPATCMHPDFKRYGNVHGSFSQCKRCRQVFKWDPLQEGWRPHGDPRSRASSNLPLPSSSNILTTTTGMTKGKGKGKTSSTRTTASKARAKARPVILPITDPDMTLVEETWDPAAYPPESDGGEDGYPSWEMDWDAGEMEAQNLR